MRSTWSRLTRSPFRRSSPAGGKPRKSSNLDDFTRDAYDQPNPRGALPTVEGCVGVYTELIHRLRKRSETPLADGRAAECSFLRWLAWPELRNARSVDEKPRRRYQGNSPAYSGGAFLFLGLTKATPSDSPYPPEPERSGRHSRTHAAPQLGTQPCQLLWHERATPTSTSHHTLLPHRPSGSGNKGRLRAAAYRPTNSGLLATRSSRFARCVCRAVAGLSKRSGFQRSRSVRCTSRAGWPRRRANAAACRSTSGRWRPGREPPC
jgi:hypothetical protein